jgi:hypothetical protein
MGTAPMANPLCRVGSVWQCCFDGSDYFFAAKIVEVLHRADVGGRRRIRDEFSVYLALENAYKSGPLRKYIALHSYGAFQGDGIDIIVLDLYDDVLNTWNEPSLSEL